MERGREERRISLAGINQNIVHLYVIQVHVYTGSEDQQSICN